jgi:hypothetical protein
LKSAATRRILGSGDECGNEEKNKVLGIGSTITRRQSTDFGEQPIASNWFGAMDNGQQSMTMVPVVSTVVPSKCSLS